MKLYIRSWKNSSAHHTTLLAAGVAFYAFLSLFPAMIAAILTYGVVADPQTVANQSARLANHLPSNAASLITDQLDTLMQTPSRSLGIGLIIAVVIALYSASSGIGHLIMAVNTAYTRREARGFISRKLLALSMTLGAIILGVVTLSLIAAAPAIFDYFVTSGPVRAALEAGRWIILLLVIMFAIGVLYKRAPDRSNDVPSGDEVKRPKVGMITATVLWLIISFGFSFYVDNFSSYGKTYGALAGVVVLLLWLWLSIFVVLFGAEVQAEAERRVGINGALDDEGGADAADQSETPVAQSTEATDPYEEDRMASEDDLFDHRSRESRPLADDAMSDGAPDYDYVPGDRTSGDFASTETTPPHEDRPGAAGEGFGSERSTAGEPGLEEEDGDDPRSAW